MSAPRSAFGMRAERRAAPKPERASRETQLALRRRETVLRTVSRPASLPSGDRLTYPSDEGQT